MTIGFQSQSNRLDNFYQLLPRKVAYCIDLVFSLYRVRYAETGKGIDPDQIRISMESFFRFKRPTCQF